MRRSRPKKKAPRITRRAGPVAVGALVASLGGCGTAEPAPPEPARVEAERELPAPELMRPEVPADPAPDLQARLAEVQSWLDGCSVTHAGQKRIVYSWTSAEQVEELRDGAPLLNREASSAGELSGFDRAISSDPNPLARFLRRRGHRTRRFGWTSPWPTRLGWEHGAYGEQLIRVTMNEGAWFAIYEPGTDEPWTVVTDIAVTRPSGIRGQEENIGLVLHIGRGPDPDGRERVYRELVIVNAHQVERFEVASEEVRARLQRDAEGLTELARLFRADPLEAPEDMAGFNRWLTEGWDSEGDPLEDRYRRCLAIGSLAYRPDPDQLEELALTLSRTPMPEELRRDGPGPRPSGASSPPPPPRFPPPSSGHWVT